MNLRYDGKTGTTVTTQNVTDLFSTAAFRNTILNTSTPDILKLILPFSYTNPDFTPYASAGPTWSTTTYGPLGVTDDLNYTKNGSFTDALNYKMHFLKK